MGENYTNEALYFLKRHPLFGPLGDEVLGEIARSMRFLPLTKGAVLVREGDIGEGLYLIKSGRVRIAAHPPDGPETTVAYLGRGEAVGELSLFAGDPHPYTIQGDTSCEFLVLTKKDFDAIIESHPQVSIDLSRALSKRLAVSFRSPVDKPKHPEVVAIVPGLPHEAALLAVINLSIAVVEQTRRRVILLDLSARSGDMARALGMNAPLSEQNMFREDDLLDLDHLRRLITVHPSGLQVLSLHPRLLRDQWLGSVPSLLSLLKDHFDFTLAVIPPDHDLFCQTVLHEADKALLVTWDQAPELARQARTAIQENMSGTPLGLSTVLLQDPHRINSEPADFRVPWAETFHQPFRDTGAPYLVLSQAGAAQTALERVARALGRLRVGLAMGSGAAYGYGLIGILKVFEREGIPVDMVTGTSMGALLGSFYCAGNNAERIAEIARGITKRWLRENIFGDLTFPHSGFLAGQTLSTFLRSILGTVEFDQLMVPFAAIATDIRSGHEVVIKEGRVVDAVRASTSLPVIFRPFLYKGRFLVDGGLVNPVPTSTIAKMGADILISVNLTAKPSVRRGLGRNRRAFPIGPRSPGLLEVLFKMIYTMQYEIAQARTEIAHVVIAPDMREFMWTDLHRSDDIARVGELAAEEAVSKLKALLPYFADHCKIPIGVSLRAY